MDKILDSVRQQGSSKDASLRMEIRGGCAYWTFSFMDARFVPAGQMMYDYLFYHIIQCSEFTGGKMHRSKKPLGVRRNAARLMVPMLLSILTSSANIRIANHHKCDRHLILKLKKRTRLHMLPKEDKSRSWKMASNNMRNWSTTTARCANKKSVFATRLLVRKSSTGQLCYLRIKDSLDLSMQWPNLT